MESYSTLTTTAMEVVHNYSATTDKLSLLHMWLSISNILPQKIRITSAMVNKNCKAAALKEEGLQ